MRHYIVYSPEMSETIPVLDYVQGPLEYFRDAASVQARTKRRAITAAVKSEFFDSWRDVARGDNVNPWSGVKADKIEEYSLGMHRDFCGPPNVVVDGDPACPHCGRAGQ